MNSSRFTDSDKVFDYLMNYVNVEKGQKTEFKLDRMRYLAERLKNPHLGRLTVHVAGSKGKGSVSAMSARILESSGYKTGLYTSPHLMRWKERISLAGGEMPDKILIDAMEEILPLVEGARAEDFPGNELPTFFELTTLVGFCAFRAAGCGAQVIEVGLGGRLDSTNIVEPDVSVITPIELEHTQYLGDTITLIAGEKAGIIKPGRPVCIAPQTPEAKTVFHRKAAELGAALFEVGVDIQAEEISVDIKGTGCRLVRNAAIDPRIASAIPREGLEIHSPMIGKIQAQNMALAALACAIAAPGIAPEAIRGGIRSAQLPARFELVPSTPPIVLDGAHTPESVRLTLSSMEALFPGPKILLFACAIDKKHEEMAKILSAKFEKIYVTKPGTFKLSDPEAVVRSFVQTGRPVESIEDTKAAVARAISEAGARKATLLVTGSFYLCAEARAFLDSRPVPGL